jgi:putative aldouronate transport system substrate-binding protein
MKKILLTAAITLVMVLVIAQGSWAGGSGQSSASAPGVDRNNLNPAGTLPVVKNKETITVMVRIENAETNYDTNWFTPVYEEKTNVHVNWYTAPAEQFKEKVNIALASDEKLDLILSGGTSDVKVTFTPSDISRLAQQQLILPLQDIIDKETKHFKEALAQVEGWREAIAMPDGNIYAIPSYMGDYHAMYYGKMWVNKEFLKNVGLTYPTTIPEFHDMLEAFKTKDANGNGDPNDEIPLMSAIDAFNCKIDTYLLSAFVYDDGGDRLYIDDNGKITAAFTSPDFQEGLRTLNQWFKEGLIARDSFTSTRSVRHQLNSQKYESIIGAMPNPHNLNLGVRETGQPVRWIDYEPIPPLKGPKGVQITRYDHYQPFQLSMPCGFIPSTCKDPVLVMRWLDYFMTPDGSLESLYGYRLRKPDAGGIGINGKPATYQRITLNPGDAYYNNSEWGQQFPHFVTFDLYEQDQKAVDMLSPDGSGQERFLTVKSRENYAPYGIAVKNILPSLFYDPEQSSEIAVLKTNINTYVDESIAKFVTGDMDPVRDWAAFQQNIKNLKIDRYLQVIQQAYDKSAFAKK